MVFGGDVENAPKWQKGISSVRRTSEVTSHWIMESDGEKIEWDSEILAGSARQKNRLAVYGWRFEQRG